MARLKFQVLAKCSTSKARVSKLTLTPTTTVDTPVFMPVGTQGTMKGLTMRQLEQTGCNMMLSNTYHIGLRPGQELIREAGGLHKFMNWNHGLLTDSGGFQMVSLLELSEVTEQGVEFQSPHDSTSRMLLTPELSTQLQNDIGANIIMQLDDVVSSLTTGPRVREAMLRSIRWLDRCIVAHARPNDQNLFAIIQGGLDTELRLECIREMVNRDTPGIAIGGLSGGEGKDKFWRVVSLCTDHLPAEKPIYCMGVGYALDLVVCSALGVDMYDCVFPTRTGRIGNALTKHGSLSLKQLKYANDERPIDAECPCIACKSYSRAVLHKLVTHETVACNLVSIHNITYQMTLMRELRESIVQDKFPAFVKQFCQDLGNTPQWAVDALASVNIQL